MPTKAELLEQAEALGLDVSDEMTKSEIEDALDQAEIAAEDDDAESSEGLRSGSSGEENLTCSSCGADAVFVDDPPHANAVGFCSKHAPKWLRNAARP